MKRNNRAGGQKGGEEKKQRKKSDFLVPGSLSASIPSPVSLSASIPSPGSPSASILSPGSLSVSSRNVCSFCIPVATFNTEKARRDHEQHHHAEEQGFYATSQLQDRSETRQLFQKYLPHLPNGITTEETPLGIYLRNAKDQIIGAFYVVITEKSVTSGEAAKIKARVYLFPGSTYAQGHIIPASTARDDASMYAESYHRRNFEPLNPNSNANVGGKIEEYCQKLRHDWGWKVCVFVLLDKNQTLGTITATNGETYTLSGQWSYLIFMERGDEHFYEAFNFPNAEPTKTYLYYKSTIAEIRSISGLEFQFEMSESISQYWFRIKKERYVRENPFPCRRTDLGCVKRFPTIKSRTDHEKFHDEAKRLKRMKDRSSQRLTKHTRVTPSSTTPDNAS